MSETQTPKLVLLGAGILWFALSGNYGLLMNEKFRPLTVAGAGLVLLLGVGTAVAVKAAVVFLIVHSLYKGALFMAAGAIDHETGTRV